MYREIHVISENIIKFRKLLGFKQKENIDTHTITFQKLIHVNIDYLYYNSM